MTGPRALRALAVPGAARRRGAPPAGARVTIPRARARARRSPGGPRESLTDEGDPSVRERSVPRACDRFSSRREDEPGSTARRADVARCFEGWGWDALRQDVRRRPCSCSSGPPSGPDTPALFRGLAGGRARRPHRRGAGAAARPPPDPAPIPRWACGSPSSTTVATMPSRASRICGRADRRFAHATARRGGQGGARGAVEAPSAGGHTALHREVARRSRSHCRHAADGSGTHASARSRSSARHRVSA